MVKVIVVGCLNLIALTILYNAKLVGTELAKILFAAIVIFTFIGIVVISLDISKRDNMNFDEYDYSFDAAAMKSKLDAANKNKKLNLGGCVNDSCCSNGTAWSQEKKNYVTSLMKEVSYSDSHGQ